MVVFAAVRELTEVEADECGGLDLKIVPGKRDQNYMNVHEIQHWSVALWCQVSCMKMKCVPAHMTVRTPSPNFNQPKLQVPSTTLIRPRSTCADRVPCERMCVQTEDTQN